jgi:hypothetical protein
MNRPLTAVAGGLWCLALVAPAFASFIPPMADPTAMRVAAADVVFVGKVASIADKTVSLPRSPGEKENVDHQVAVIKVSEGLFGAKDDQEIRVAIAPLPRPGAPIVGLPLRAVIPQLQLAVDQEGCFFLNKRPDGDYYTAAVQGAFVDKKDPLEYPGTLTDARKTAKLLADPKASLASKVAQDRFLTAALLVHRYRMPRGRQKTDALDAEESKLILKAFADYDWNPGRQVNGVQAMFSANPHLVIGTLGATEKDGWKEPKNFRAMIPAARKWFKDSSETFRIQKYVLELKKEEKKEEKKRDE